MGFRAQRIRATRCFGSPARESSTTRHAQKVRINPPPCFDILNRRMSTMACRATSYSGGVRMIQMNAEQRPMGGAGKYCMSNVLFGRGSNHFNALFGRGFGEYIVTLVNLRKGCMQQACSTPDTTFVSLPTGGRNLQPTYSVDNAFEGTRQPSTNRHWRLLLRSSPCRRSSLQYRRLLLWIRRGRSRRQRPPTTTPCLPRHRRRVRRRYIAHNIGRPSMTRS